MEEIIRCDRCGKQIEEFKTLKYVTIEAPTVVGFPNCETYELCSECVNKIIEWINVFHNKASPIHEIFPQTILLYSNRSSK